MSDEFNVFGAKSLAPLEPIAKALHSSREAVIGWVITAQQEGKATLYLIDLELADANYAWSINEQAAIRHDDVAAASKYYEAILANPRLPEGYSEECVEFKIRPLLLGPGVEIKPPQRG